MAKRPPKQKKSGKDTKSSKNKNRGSGSTKAKSLVDNVRSISVKTLGIGGRRRGGVTLYANTSRGGRALSRPAPALAGMHTVPTGSSTQQPMSYYFPFTPQQIQYANVSPEMSELQRPGKMPIIAFNRFKSRQLSLKFLIAVPQDGLFTSIDESMEFLFKMANTALPVYFTNMDRQISNPLSNSTSSNQSKIFWSITDLNFSSVRRNENNQITVAEANITLVENMNPIIKVAQLPVISYSEAVPTTPPSGGSGGSGNKEDQYPTYTEVRNRPRSGP